VALGEGPGIRASSRPLLRLLGGSVLLVLLIACANISSLLLARSVSRRREVAVRIAVGAGRSRLVRQWLTESVLLSLAGGLGGLLIAYWGAPLLHIAGIPDTVHLAVNGRVLTFTFVVAAGCGVLFGLAPVVQTMRGDTITALRDEGGAVATGSHAARLRRLFVVFQVAVSLMLLVGAGLFLRTLRNAQAVDLGYRLDSTMVADINLDLRGYSQEAGTVAYQQILDRLAEIPGVAAAGAARIAVLSGGARTVPISRDGRPVAAGPNGRPNVPERDLIAVRVNVVSDGYLDAMGIPLIRGRDFSAADGANAQRVAIVSRSLAATLWPNQDPIGKSLGDNAALVVGVVPDTVYRNALEREPPPFFYLPLAQNYESGVTLHVRAAHGDPLALLPLVRTAVREVDPAIAISRPQRLRSLFDQSIAAQRMMATLVGLFGGIALVLAAVGLYGVMAHLAGQRRTEIGIRLALGAKPTSILSLILGEGLRLAAIGAVIGLAAAFAATRWLESQLFGVRPTDPLTFAAVCLLLTVVAIFACLIPARRAMRVDPAVALRST
jgi:predicted permease